MTFTLPVLTQSLNPSDTGPRALSSVTIPAASLAAAMGVNSTVAIWGGCTGNLVWNALMPTIAGSSPNYSGYIATGIENLYLYLYAGSQTTGAFGPLVAPATNGGAWSRTLSTIHGTVPPWSVMGDMKLVLYQTGPIRQGGVIPAGSLAELKVSDGLQIMNMSMSAVTVNVLACSITTPVVNVRMPAIFKSSFTGVGSTSATTDFRIGANCDSGVMPTITFSGPTNNGEANIFAINSGASAASGIGVQLLYSDKVVNQNEAIAMNPTVANGAIEFPFGARYVQVSDELKSGDVNSTITFTLAYK